MSTKTIWKLDPSHSEVQFKVKHLVISTVTGQFTDFTGEIHTEGNEIAGANAIFEAKVDSISTNNADRDGHLKSADFFDAASHPTINFSATSFEKVGGDEFEITGDLTLRGITKSIKLKSELGGMATDPYGQEKVGFEITGKISRKEFGLTWSAVTEAGGVVVGDEIKLLLNLQFVKQA
jgi:polyisoprenoid-binding protein YceI